MDSFNFSDHLAVVEAACLADSIVTCTARVRQSIFELLRPIFGRGGEAGGLVA